MWAKPKDGKHPLIGPQVKFLCLSYGETLALDSALAMRRLIESDWYQDRWGRRVQLTSDQEAKSKFDTTAGGTRISAGFDGTLTGRGGDVKIIDDPLKADDAEREVIRDNVFRKYNGTLKSRVTDPRHTAEVVIMQRLGEADLSGRILDEEDDDLVHLLLPAEYEPSRSFMSPIGWSDPRINDGDILWPERFGPKELAPFKRDPYEWAGQWQQRPEPRGGGLFKYDWWQYEHIPVGKQPPPMSYIVASLDSAYTKQERNDPSGFTVWGVYRDAHDNPKVLMLQAWRKHLELHGPSVERIPGEHEAAYVARAKQSWGLVEWVAYECKRLRVDKLLIEAKASGLSVAQEMQRLYANEGWGVETVNPEGDKYARAVAVVHLWADGFVHVPASQHNPKDPDSGLFPREWADLVIREMGTFPNGKFRDLADSATQAMKHLRSVGLAVRREERDAARIADSMYRPKVAPLYHT